VCSSDLSSLQSTYNDEHEDLKIFISFLLNEYLPITSHYHTFWNSKWVQCVPPILFRCCFWRPIKFCGSRWLCALGHVNCLLKDGGDNLRPCTHYTTTTTTTSNSGQGSPLSPHLNNFTLELNDIKLNFCFRYRTNLPSIHEDTLGLSKNNPDGFQKL